jgi:hypothetical protein
MTDGQMLIRVCTDGFTDVDNPCFELLCYLNEQFGLDNLMDGHDSNSYYIKSGQMAMVLRH